MRTNIQYANGCKLVTCKIIYICINNTLSFNFDTLYNIFCLFSVKIIFYNLYTFPFFT